MADRPSRFLYGYSDRSAVQVRDPSALRPTLPLDIWSKITSLWTITHAHTGLSRWTNTSSKRIFNDWSNLRCPLILIPSDMYGTFLEVELQLKQKLLRPLRRSRVPWRKKVRSPQGLIRILISSMKHRFNNCVAVSGYCPGQVTSFHT
ncbi:hypothetical protein TNCV_700121 [Trichonephila clavipes]|nr:hypothetical protein TNCV_700121 [Trichonephila clavipes]